MSLDPIRLAALARSLKKAATVLILGIILLIPGVSQAMATATNGFLTTAFVTDGLCLAGPYKNSATADLSVSYGATLPDDQQKVSLTNWNGGSNGGRAGAFPPPGSTTVAQTVQLGFLPHHIVGNFLYLYLHQGFTDAGNGRGESTSPFAPTDLAPGFAGNYHQTAVDMSQDPDCIPPVGSSIIIRQETDGTDAVFGFSSSTSGLNLSVPTSGGRGESAAISLAAGTYSVTADDMSGAGFGLAGLACSDNDSTTDIASRTANIVLGVGEALVCTFASAQSSEKTSRLIEDFLITRAELILANQPDVQRRIDRLNGVVSSGGSPVSALMGYLPGLVEGSPLTVSTSLSAIDRMAGNEATGSFDMWIEGTFALFDAGGPDGTFNTASLGADYLVTPDLLIGGFVQMDHLSQSSSLDPATISGTGWLAGPYATARLNENFYLDVLAAAGASSNQVSPSGTYEDGFDATRWLLSASLQGQWQWDNWTFGPRARVSYFEETTKAYTDSLGVGISSITAGLGQIAVGPAISYRSTTDGNVVIDTGLRFEAIADILRTSTASGFGNLHARIEGTIDLSLPGGAKLGLSSALDGIGGDTGTATSAKIRVSLPIN